MHIGLSRPPTPPHPIPDVDGALVAQLAEDLGFESIFYGEHPITPVDGESNNVHSSGVPFFQDLMIMLARASSVTRRIKLGAGIFLAPVHQPVLFAKQLASLDFYSEGRLIVGAGVGWSRIECEAMGGNFDRRWAQAREVIEICKELWTKDVAEYHGEFFDLPPVMMFPKPATKLGPPVLLPGPAAYDGAPLGSDPKRMMALKRIVSYADGWLPAFVGSVAMEAGLEVVREGLAIMNRMCAEKGRDPKELSATVMMRTEIHDQTVEFPKLVSKDVMRRYEDLGVERLIVTIPTLTGPEHAREILPRMADALL